MFDCSPGTIAYGSRIVGQIRSSPGRARGVTGLLAVATRLMQKRPGTRIGLNTPVTKGPSFQFPYHADVARRVRAVALQGTQLPDPTPGTNLRTLSARHLGIWPANRVRVPGAGLVALAALDVCVAAST